MRILSLIPSATEIVYALGLGDDLVGVTAECDYPAEARGKPSVSAPVVAAGSSIEIDSSVRAAVVSGQPLYDLDTELVRALAPDLILAQDICRVCAVPSGDVTAALSKLGSEAAVLSLDPRDFGGVLQSIYDVADRAGVRRRGADLVATLLDRIEAVAALIAPESTAPRAVCVEWPDPVFIGGNWVPDMVRLAGGSHQLVEAGEPSVEVRWQQVLDATPEVIVHMPCGYNLQGAIQRSADLLGELEALPDCQMWAVDGTAYFSRPGPRLVDGIEILAHAFHPRVVPPPSADRARRLR